MPGTKEQNEWDLKKSSADCYQLNASCKGIRKIVNESKNSSSDHENRSVHMLYKAQVHV